VLYTNSDREDDSESSSDTMTQSDYDAAIAEKRKQIEQLNKDLEIIDHSIRDVEEVAKQYEVLPDHKKDENERLDTYKEDYPDYFYDIPGISIQESLDLIRDEILKEKNEKLTQKNIMEKQLLPKSESQEGNTHADSQKNNAHGELSVNNSDNSLPNDISSYDHGDDDFE
jgi:hypothetical protein